MALETAAGAFYPVSRTPRNRRGFTLVEILAATAVFALIMLMVLSITNQTGKIWKDSNSKIQAFQNARGAYTTLTARLRQTTLNTYLDYYNSATPPQPRTAANASTFVPSFYARNSDLHFIVDQSKTITPGSADLHPGHAVFFQAPLGFTQNTSTYGKMPSSLNACGYFVEFNTDKPYFPTFLTGTVSVQERYRYRLMEFLQPSESLAVYNCASSGASTDYNKWFTSFLPPNATLAKSPLRVLAENIVALVVLPQRSAKIATAGPSLAPNYTYDSRAGNITTPSHHQLPPLLRVVMVAIDEPSALRLNPKGTTNPPGFNAALGNLFQAEANLETDLQSLAAALTDAHANYRIFDTTISIQGSKWNDGL